MKLREKAYTPVADSVWIDFDLEESMHSGKILLPNNTSLPPFIEATVLAIGPKCTQVERGDKILVNSNAVMKIKVGTEETQLFTKEDRIVAVLTDPFDSDPV